MKKILSILVLVFLLTSIDVSAIGPRQSRVKYYTSAKHRKKMKKRSARAHKKVCTKYFVNAAYGRNNHQKRYSEL